MTGGGRVLLPLLVVPVALFLFAPSFVIVPMSFSASDYLEFPPSRLSLRWYVAFLSSPEWLRATGNSVMAATLSMLVATPLGTFAAYGAGLAARRRGLALNAILLLPLFVPVVLLAVGIFFAFARLGLNNTLFGLVTAHTLVALPYVFVTAGAGLTRFDLRQVQAAKSLGAGEWRAFTTVVLPQIKPALFSGAMLAFAVSLDETIISLFIATGDRATLTRRMFTSLRDQIDPTIAAVSTMLLLAAILLLAVASLANARRTIGRN